MYEKFYELEQTPFGLTPDPSNLYLSPSHKEALAGLCYAVMRRKGFVVLTGQPGTGKTTLVRRLLETIRPSDPRTSIVFNPTVSPAEFLELMLLDFGVENIPRSKARRIAILHELLLTAQRQGSTAVLIVDEAHKLSAELLEEIRLLSNYETNQNKLIQVVLAGQPELTDLLNQPELMQLKQRISVRLTLHALTAGEVKDYLEFRWAKAAARRPLPFDDDALRAVSRCSDGIPRVINALCDNALLNAYGCGSAVVTGAHVDEALRDLDMHPIALLLQEPKVVSVPVPAPVPDPGRLTVASAECPRASGRGAGLSLLSADQTVEKGQSLFVRLTAKLRR